MSLLNNAITSLAALLPADKGLTSLALERKSAQATFPSGSTAGDMGGFGVRDGRGGWVTGTFFDYLDAASARLGTAPVEATLSSVFMAFMTVIAENFIQGDLVACQVQPDGSEVPLPDHPLSVMLRWPSADLTPEEVWTPILTDRIMFGVGYTLVTRDGARRPNGLFPTPSLLLTPRWPADGSAWISRYDYRPFGYGGRVESVETRDVVPFRAGQPDRSQTSQGRLGLPPLGAVQTEIDVDEAASRFTKTILNNMGRPSVVISARDATTSLEPVESDALIAAYEKRTKDRNIGRPVYANGQFRFDTIGFNPDELTLDSVRKTSEERVGAVLKVPLIAAGFGLRDASSYANMTTAFRQLWLTSLIPLGKSMGASLERTLLPQFKDGAKLRIRYDTSKVWAMKPDRSDEEKRARDNFAGGVISKQEARTVLGFERDDKDDYFLIPSATAAVVRVGEDAADVFAGARPAPTPPGPAPTKGLAPGAKALADGDTKDASADDLAKAEDEAAEVFWKSHAGRRYRKLIEAEAAS